MKLFSLNQSIFLIFSLSILNGCTPTTFITKEYQDPNFVTSKINKSTNIETYVVNNINVKEFVQSFNTEYKSTEKFTSFLQRQITDTLRYFQYSNSKKGIDQSIGDKLATISFNPQLFNEYQAIFDSSSADYFFIIKSVVIDNEVVVNQSYSTPGPNGSMMNSGPSHSETCIVTLNIDIWSVKEKRKVLVFSASGESTVSLLFFKTALEKAVKQSIFNMTKYLKDGTTKSKF